MTQYYPTIGLEIHAELKTKSKMFCGCKNDPDEERPNWNVCPICMGHPGTLPVVNKQAVTHVLRVGTAIGSNTADFTEFDRKNYFYPDIPKGYQISQYKFPLISGGKIAGVELTRIHLEEDTATSSHDQGDFSLANFNRAGVPLMELVTEPAIHSAEQAGVFAREFQLLLRTLEAGDANMEKGEMRVEANISISTHPYEESDKAYAQGDFSKFGTKVEVKNLNSFKAVEKAIAYELNRHIALLEAGETLVQETRGWDDNKQATFSQRKKENSNDYRYFPDPDITKFKLSEIPEFSGENLKASLPELPKEKRDRFVKNFGLKPTDIEVLIIDSVLETYFDMVVPNGTSAKHAQLAVNYILSDINGLLKDADKGSRNETLNSKIPASSLVSLINMIAENKISSRGAKDIIEILWKGEKNGVAVSEKNPVKIAEQFDLIQKSDEGSLKPILEKIISENPKSVADYKAGKEAALMFFVGQGMKLSKGAANPEVLKKIAIDIIAGM